MERARCWSVGLALLAVSAPPALAQFPQKAVRIVAPYAPGGALDLTARVVGQKLAEAWGQQVVVENRPGGAGLIGSEIVAKSAPDGYTLLLASPAEVAINPHLFRKMPFDPVRDFAPVSLAVSTPLLLAVHPSIPARDVKGFVALARSRPGTINYASAGTGGVQHLAGELLKVTAKIDIVHVPYKGAGPAVVDLVGGQVTSGFLGLPPALPHVRAGKLRALAVTSATRTAAAKDLPTFVEAGIPQVEIVNWFAFFVPAATPREIVAKLSTDIARASTLPEVRERMAQAGADTIGSTAEELAKYLKTESARYGELVRISGAKAD